MPLLLVEQAFFSANILKLFEGGWVPLTIAAGIALIMWTWVRGTKLLTKQTKRNEADLDWLVRKLEAKPPHRVPGTAVFLTGDPTAAPTSMMHNLKHNKVMHERNVLLTIKTAETPRVARHERVTVERISDHFIRIIARYGFMETPNVPKILENCPAQGLQYRNGLGVVLPVAALAARDQQVRDAALAGATVHCARQQRRGCDDLLPDSDRSRRRGRNASAGLTKNGEEALSPLARPVSRESD